MSPRFLSMLPLIAPLLLVAPPAGLAAAPPEVGRADAPADAPPEVVPPTLAVPAPRLEATLRRRDLAIAPAVEVTVGADGVPRDIVVTAGPGPAAAAAIIAAVEALRFNPATVDGQPAPVRLEIALPTDVAPWQGLARRAPEAPPPPRDALVGQVLERGTRAPLAGLPVVLDDGARETLTDPDGRFAFEAVREGARRLTIPAFDHAPYDAVVDVPSEPLLIRLDPRPSRAYRTLVQGRAGADAARVVVPMERAREVPGSSGDPIKVLESLPGVARPPAAGPGAGQISIRGSAPEDTRFYVDGLPLFQLYHFGNIYSVLQDTWIRAIDYRPGGFSAEYGDATGGLLDVALADVATDGVHGHVDVNIYHVAALVTAPIGDRWAVGAAVRRSWVDSILSAVVDGDSARFSTAPRYYDYQARADYRPSDRATLRLLAFGSDDQLALIRDAPDPADPTSRGFALSRSFHQFQGTWTQQLTDELGLRLGLATSYQRLTVAPGDTRFDLTFDPVTLRAALAWRGSPRLSVRGGVDAQVTRFKVDANVPAPTKEGQVPLPGASQEVIRATEEGFTSDFAGWGEVTWRPLEALTAVAGLRLTTWVGGFDAAALDPRVTVTWDVDADTALSLAGGLNHQAPAPDETSAAFGNPDLDPERAAYVNVGVRRRVGDFLEVDLQGFYKVLDDLVSPTDAFDGPPLDSAGTGWIAGAELLVRLTTPTVDGWLSYTLSRSRRTDRPGGEERFYSADQTHVVALVAGVALGAGWRLGTRVRYATGNPFTPLEAAYFDASSDVYVPTAAARALSRRLQPFFQLDLRVDKRFVFDVWQLELYLELSNATNRGNIEQVGYNYDYSAREDIVGLPILPSLGVRASW